MGSIALRSRGTRERSNVLSAGGLKVAASYKASMTVKVVKPQSGEVGESRISYDGQERPFTGRTGDPSRRPSRAILTSKTSRIFLSGCSSLILQHSLYSASSSWGDQDLSLLSLIAFLCSRSILSLVSSSSPGAMAPEMGYITEILETLN